MPVGAPAGKGPQLGSGDLLGGMGPVLSPARGERTGDLGVGRCPAPGGTPSR